MAVIVLQTVGMSDDGNQIHLQNNHLIKLRNISTTYWKIIKGTQIVPLDFKKILQQKRNAFNYFWKKKRVQTERRIGRDKDRETQRERERDRQTERA